MLEHAASRLAIAAALCFVSSAIAQRTPSGLPEPRIYQLSPAGAKAGSSVEVVVTGRHIEDGEKLVFSHPGVKAEPVPEPKAEVDPKTKQPRQGMGKRPPAENYKYRVTVPADVPLGNLDVRLVNKWGVSNARAFVVGDLPEVAEVEPNNDADKPQKVELNQTINGNIAGATDVDYYAFAAKKGQRIVIACLASSIDSRLQPAIEVYDKNDRQIAANRNYRDDDAVTDFTAPEDGDYHVRAFQFTHTMRAQMQGGMPAGSSDHFYRLTITTAPWIDAVVPSVVEPGKTANVTVYGRNLPGGKRDESAKLDDSVLEKLTMSVTAPAAKDKLTYSGSVPPAAGWLDGFELRVKNPSGASNAFLLGLARAPVVLDNGNNDTPETAQDVSLPCEIAGLVEKRRDRDWFSFTAKKGETWNIEVISNRLGAPTFMTILLHNPATKSDVYESPLAENMQRVSRKFFSRSEDPPAYRFTAPADGKFQLLVASRAGDTLFGARHTYAVRITRDDPDFRLVAMGNENSSPDVPVVPAGGQAAFTVLLDRIDPFTGSVELTVEGLPAGVTCQPQVIGPGVRETSLVLSAADGAAAWSGEVKIKGTATIRGQKVVREARGASILWPVQPNNNITTESRLERGVWIGVAGKAPFTLTPALDKATVTQGDKATIKVAVKRLWPDLKAPFQVGGMQEQNQQGRELPQGLTVNNNQPVTVAPNQNEATLAVTVQPNVVPGTYNVVLRGQTQVPYSKDPMAKQKPNANVVAPSTAVTITVLPKSLATLSANQPTVKVGASAKLTVRVNRQFEYDGPFEVTVALPPGTQGVEVAKAVIPAGKDEVELEVKAAANAAPGNRANLVVKAVALFEGKTPIAQETKVSVNVTK